MPPAPPDPEVGPSRALQAWPGHIVLVQYTSMNGLSMPFQTEQFLFGRCCGAARNFEGSPAQRSIGNPASGAGEDNTVLQITCGWC